MTQITPSMSTSPFCHTFILPLPKTPFTIIPHTANPTRSLSPQASTIAVSTTASPPISPHFNRLNEPWEPKSLNSVKQIHAQMIKSPNGTNPYVKVETLIVWYMKFGDFGSAVTVSFLGLGGYFMVWREFWEEFRGFGGDPVEILEVFVDLYRKDVEFDGGNFGVVIRVCEDLRVHWLGAEVHACLIKTGYEWDVNLMCGLMRYYGNCWGIEYGDKVFDAIPKHEARPWSEAIAISLRNGRHEKVLRLFRVMQHSSVRADNGIVDKVLQACGKLGDVREGKQVHGFVIRSCMYEDLAVGNSFIAMYCRAQEIGLARKDFVSMKNCNLCSWNSMISGYSSIGDFDEVWNLFYRMESRNVTGYCYLELSRVQPFPTWIVSTSSAHPSQYVSRKGEARLKFHYSCDPISH